MGQRAAQHPRRWTWVQYSAARGSVVAAIAASISEASAVHTRAPPALLYAVSRPRVRLCVGTS